MILLAPTLVALVGLLPFVSCEKVGYFESTSCADPKGLASCYKLVDERYSTCINENCGGGGEACSKSCGGSVSCMNAKCPGLGIDCMNACAAEQSALQIDCAGAHCWNQVCCADLLILNRLVNKSVTGLLLRISKHCIGLYFCQQQP